MVFAAVTLSYMLWYIYVCLREHICVFCVVAESRDLRLSACRYLRSQLQLEAITSVHVYCRCINTKWERGGRQVQRMSHSLTHTGWEECFAETNLRFVRLKSGDVPPVAVSWREKWSQVNTNWEDLMLQRQECRTIEWESETVRVRNSQSEREGPEKNIERLSFRMHESTSQAVTSTCRASTAQFCRREQIHLKQMAFTHIDTALKVQH